MSTSHFPPTQALLWFWLFFGLAFALLNVAFIPAAFAGLITQPVVMFLVLKYTRDQFFVFTS